MNDKNSFLSQRMEDRRKRKFKGEKLKNEIKNLILYDYRNPVSFHLYFFILQLSLFRLS